MYETKCAELGVVPSRRVLQQLQEATANMANCKLGRRGAAALGRALTANTAITELNLADNGLDSKVWVMARCGSWHTAPCRCAPRVRPGPASLAVPGWDT